MGSRHCLESLQNLNCSPYTGHESVGAGVDVQMADDADASFPVNWNWMRWSMNKVYGSGNYGDETVGDYMIRSPMVEGTDGDWIAAARKGVA